MTQYEESEAKRFGTTAASVIFYVRDMMTVEYHEGFPTCVDELAEELQISSDEILKAINTLSDRGIIAVDEDDYRTDSGAAVTISVPMTVVR